jgi:hypothetical protein
MCSPMLTVQSAPTSALLVQRDCCDISPAVHDKYETDFSPVRMNWVLVDAKGNSRAQMRWVVDR